MPFIVHCLRRPRPASAVTKDPHPDAIPDLQFSRARPPPRHSQPPILPSGSVPFHSVLFLAAPIISVFRPPFLIASLRRSPFLLERRGRRLARPLSRPVLAQHTQ